MINKNAFRLITTGHRKQRPRDLSLRLRSTPQTPPSTYEGLTLRPANRGEHVQGWPYLTMRVTIIARLPAPGCSLRKLTQSPLLSRLSSTSATTHLDAVSTVPRGQYNRKPRPTTRKIHRPALLQVYIYRASRSGRPLHPPQASSAPFNPRSSSTDCTYALYTDVQHPTERLKPWWFALSNACEQQRQQQQEEAPHGDGAWPRSLSTTSTLYRCSADDAVCFAANSACAQQQQQ